jgi:hypothetical protein
MPRFPCRPIPSDFAQASPCGRQSPEGFRRIMDDERYDEYKQKIIEYLGSLPGKGADTIVSIGKQVGLKRKDASQVIQRMEQEGILMPAGVAAGVAGYKLKK